MVENPMGLSLPQSISLADLKYQHKDYNPDKLKKYPAMLSGGDAFRDIKADLLIKRPIEENGGEVLFEYRLKKGWFIPLGKGVIDRIVGSEYKSDITLVAQLEGQDEEPQEQPGDDLPQGTQGTPPPAPQPQVDPDEKALWDMLTKDVDGQHTDLQELFKKASYEIKTNGRAYFGVNYIDSEDYGERPAIFLLPAAMVDDWTDKYVRTYKCTQYASKGWGKPDMELCRWVYYTASQIYTYDYSKVIGTTDPDDAKASLAFEPEPHDFGRVPIFSIDASYCGWIMDTIFDLLVGLFNRQVALTCSIDSVAYANLVIKLLADNPSKLKEVVNHELGAVVLKQGEELGYESPDSDIPSNSFKDEERLKQELLECLSAVPSQAMTTQGQNARQGATAKGMDAEPWHVLLSTYVMPVEDSFEELLDSIRKHEGIKSKVQINGLYDFGGSLEDIKDYVLGKETNAQKVANLEKAQAIYSPANSKLVNSTQDPVNASGSRVATDV